MISRPSKRRAIRLGARRRTERGAVFVEFALAVPILLLLGLGLVEYGMAWMATNDVNSAARDAARSGTSSPAYLTSDRTILMAIGSSLDSKELAGLKKVIVYKATSTSGAVPASCLAKTPSSGSPGSPVGVKSSPVYCNVYGPKQVAFVLANPNNLTYFGGDSSGSACKTTEIDYNYCPASRNHSQSTDNLDYLGVYIESEHKSVTNFSFGNQMIRRKAIFRLEPKYGGD